MSNQTCNMGETYVSMNIHILDFTVKKKLYNMVKWEWELMNEIDYTGIKLDKIYCTKVIPEKTQTF